MKRILIALLLVITCVCLTFTACKQKTEEVAPAPPAEAPAPPAEAPAPPAQ